MDAEQGKKAVQEPVKERQGHRRAAWPSESDLVKARMRVIGPYKVTEQAMLTVWSDRRSRCSDAGP